MVTAPLWAASGAAAPSRSASAAMDVFLMMPSFMRVLLEAAGRRASEAGHRQEARVSSRPPDVECAYRVPPGRIAGGVATCTAVWMLLTSRPWVSDARPPA